MGSCNSCIKNSIATDYLCTLDFLEHSQVLNFRNVFIPPSHPNGSVKTFVLILFQKRDHLKFSSSEFSVPQRISN